MRPVASRRDLLKLGLAAFAGEAPPADITLRIGEINAEIGPGRIVRTLAYNGQTPGPLLRMTEGRAVTVEVVNETHRPELVHWHGFHVPPEVDGAHEEGTPMVQGGSRRRYTFTPRPAGARWYHTHAMAGHNLAIGSYSGQFGMAVVAPAADPARYDFEVPILIHEWEPFFAAANDIEYRLYSINGKMLGAGEPVRVRRGQRALFRFLNASATMTHRLALPGHTFQVIATDGNTTPAPRPSAILQLAPGERIDAIVAMNEPGVWILGETDQRQRSAGAGIVVEYGGAKGRPRWAPVSGEWDLTALAAPGERPAGEAHRIELVIEPGVNGNLWAINGKSFPHTDPILLKGNLRNRLVIVNRGMMDHPVHTHRHTFEVTRYGGKAIRGLFKDVVVVPAHQSIEVDIEAASPGPSLFHCHQQFHMDFGFMAVMQRL
jgi:FtsP/CotA-like multicopper oxidase with cupredoxin domain